MSVEAQDAVRDSALGQWHGLLCFGLLTLCFLPASGCVCTALLNGVGTRREHPAIVGDPASPVLEAWADKTRSRLAIRYSTQINKPFVQYMPGYPGPEEEIAQGQRWLNMDCRAVLKEFLSSPAGAGPADRRLQGSRNVFTISAEYLERQTSSQPRWSLADFERLEIQPASNAEGAKAGPFLGVNSEAWEPMDSGTWQHTSDARVTIVKATAYFLADFPETEGEDVIVLELPHRRYRTAGGWAAQTLIPAALVADIVVTPFFIVITIIGASGH